MKLRLSNSNGTIEVETDPSFETTGDARYAFDTLTEASRILSNGGKSTRPFADRQAKDAAKLDADVTEQLGARLRTVNFEPGDIAVLEIDQPLPVEDMTRIREAWNKAATAAGIGHIKSLTFDKGVRLAAVLHPAKTGADSTADQSQVHAVVPAPKGEVQVP